MITLLAHHVEVYHIPILAVMFGVGCRVGWNLLSRWSTKKDER